MKFDNLLEVKEFTFYLQKYFLQICGVLLCVSFLILIAFTTLSRSNPLFLVLFFLPYTIFVITIVIAQRMRLLINKRSMLTIVLITSIIQILLLNLPVTLSDDVYRYFLEGKAILNGFNPYQIPIIDLPSYITEDYLTQLSNANLVSPYPPLALFLFFVLALIFNNPLSFRLMFSVAFLLTILGIEKLLSEINKWKIIIFAWNPLLLLETASGSHFDVIIVLILTIGLIALEKRKPVIAALSYLIAFFLKYYAILLICLYWKKFSKEGKGLIVLGITFYSMLSFFSPILLQGIITYIKDWNFNASAVWLISESFLSLMQAKIVLESIFMIIFALLTLKIIKSDERPHETAGLIMGIFLILQPTFHPWYIFWVFPFILLDNPKVFWSWIALSGLLVLSYNVYILFDQYGTWYESPIIRILEYTPFLLIFLYETVLKDRNVTFKGILISKKSI